MKVLLVEDEQGLVITLTDRLRSEGFDVDVATDGKIGFEKAQAGAYDLIILDVMLPKKNGYDVCRDLRQKGIGTPVLMLTAKGETIDKVLGLKLGADDYLTKPFEVIELLARIEALLRRAPAQTNGRSHEAIRFGEITVDFKRAEVTRGSAPIDLSAMEFKLLQHLVENRGSGIRAMIRTMRDANLEPPIFDDRRVSFQVTFRNHSLMDAETIAWLSQPGAAAVTGQVVRVCGQSLLGA